MKITPLKLVFGIQVAIVAAIVFGFAPRELSLFLLGLIAFYIFFSPLEDGLVFFIGSVPIFIALPITESFDAITMGRVVILFLFSKWVFMRGNDIFTITFKKIIDFFKSNKLELYVAIFLLLCILSVFIAGDRIAAVKKIIYLVNISVLFLIVKDLIGRNNLILRRITRAIFVSAGLVMFIALAQLISVYFFDFGGFWIWWANHFSFNFYGANLRQIVFENNAWFTVSPSGPIIRLFGSFTDPHSFGLFLLLSVPFFIVWVFSLIEEKLKLQFIPPPHRTPCDIDSSIAVGVNGDFKFFPQNLMPREKVGGFVAWPDFGKINLLEVGRVSFFSRLILLFILLFFIVLSQTRGIWLGSFFGLLAVLFLFLKRLDWQRSASLVLMSVLIFISLIPVASVFVNIPQFKQRQSVLSDGDVIFKRLISISDLEETSNSGRLYIWQQSFNSILKNPWLGVGIGNFPKALAQDVALAKAGSSAHNLYLNFIVETGILSLFLFILIIFDIFKTLVFNIKFNISFKMRLLMVGFFVYLMWIFGYSLFDIALLDERVFLLFLSVLGIIYAIRSEFMRSEPVNLKTL